MIKKLSLLVGLGAGYVLGSKAGTQRYNEIKRKVDDLLGKPEVQKATSTITSTVSDLASTAKDKAAGRLTGTADRPTHTETVTPTASPTIDLNAAPASTPTHL